MDSNERDSTVNRFLEVEDHDVQDIISLEENENTKKKTKQDMAIFVAYLHSQNERREVQEIPPDTLDSYISKFLLSVRKRDGDNYEPTTLRGMVSSIDRYLKRNRYVESVITGHSFEQTRQVLKSKQKQLKRLGKGNKPKEASPLTSDEIDTLYEKGEFGNHSPHALINTLWFNNCLHFGLRGGKEQRNLKWGDVTLKVDTTGKEYLEYSTERQTKTRPGDKPRDSRSTKPRMYDNPSVQTQRNPVNIYKVYREKRPRDTLHDESPFYLAVNCQSSSKLLVPEAQWFKNQPMGVNKLNLLLKECATRAGLSSAKRITNHSARKTLVQNLQDHDIPPNQIIQVTGHKNLMSVNNYSSLREQQQETISSLLSSNLPPSSTPQRQMQSLATTVNAVETTTTAKETTENNENQTLSLFYGNYITGGTFNIQVSSNKLNKMIAAESPKRKKFKRIQAIESSDSSQD